MYIPLYKMSNIYSNITIVLHTIINRWQNVIKFRCTCVSEYLKHFLATHVRAGTEKDRCMMQVNETNTRESKVHYVFYLYIFVVYICLGCHVACFPLFACPRIMYPATTTGYLILAGSKEPRLASRHRSINVIIFIYCAISW